MRINTAIWLASIPICSLIILSFIEYNLGMNLLMFTIVLVLAVFSYSIFIISDTIYLGAIRRNRESEELLIALDSICRRMRSGERFDRSIASTINGLDNDGLCFAVLSRVSGMMKGGYSFGQAMDSINNSADGNLRGSETYKFLRRVRTPDYLPPNLSDIYSEYMGYLKENEMCMDRDAGAVQRYITMLMVGGTIMPSLVLFGFVGYSILNVSLMLVGFSVMAFVAVLPTVYGIIRAKLGSSYAW